MPLLKGKGLSNGRKRPASTSNGTLGTQSITLDSRCPLDADHHHLHSENNVLYSIMLKQGDGTSIDKFYALDIIKHDGKSQFYVWMHWGETGKITGDSLDGPHSSMSDALEVFEKKFLDKTGNSWSARDSFVKKKRKFELVKKQPTFVLDPVEPKVEEKKEVHEKDTDLDKKIYHLLELMFSTRKWEASLKELNYDLRLLPLEKLTKEHIETGYKTLKKVTECISQKLPQTDLDEACSEFYTKIPHNFGMSRPPLIKKPQEVKKKLELLETLNYIHVAYSKIQGLKDRTDDTPLSDFLPQLNCDIKPMDPTDTTYQMIKKYVKNSHASTHDWYDLELEDVFEIRKDSDDANFKDLGNKMLLWHGSRLSNWCGILHEGLQIAPSEAPSLGFMFGKGIFFTDRVSKSANYCYASQDQPYGFALLCDVSLGNVNEKDIADNHADQLPVAKHSTLGLGRTVPEPCGATKLKDGTVVPMGKGVPCSTSGYRCLNYNEYHIYDRTQMKPRYLVKLKFDFKFARP